MSLPPQMPHDGNFRTTQWTTILRAAHQSSSGGFDALSEVCQTYWYPLYAYLRRTGHNEDSAEELTQAFFEHILSTEALRVANSERGRFRSFLLNSLKNFVINSYVRNSAEKRGGNVPPISWDGLAPAVRYRLEPADTLTPEALYERRWALTVVDQALGVLRAEYERGEKTKLFDDLKPALVGEPTEPYATLAQRHNLTEGSIKVAVHRLRQRFREALLEIVSSTVTNPRDVEDEIRTLIGALDRK